MNETITTRSDLDPIVLTLARELARAEARCVVLAGARRRSLAAVVLAAAVGFGMGAYVVAPATAQPQPVGVATVQTPAAAPPQTRDQLMAMLPPEDRARLQEFEQRVSWVSRYTRSSPDFDAGAAIALFLGEIVKSMESVPRMSSEMQAMNAKMNALPFLANEVAGMNAKMGVMTADMDSTMGRAGRMMPWGW
jgi:hypothetical protein